MEKVQMGKETSGMMVLQAKDGEQIYWMYHNNVETDENGKLM
jgi:hypothetical protein